MHRARTGRLARRLALEQLPVVCISGTGRGQAQPRMARSQTYAHSGMTVLSSGPFQKQERTGHPSRRVQPRGCCSYPPSVSLSSRGALGVPRDLLSTAHIEETVFQGRIDHSPRIAAAERRKRIAPGEARFFCARNPGSALCIRQRRSEAPRRIWVEQRFSAAFQAISTFVIPSGLSREESLPPPGPWTCHRSPSRTEEGRRPRHRRAPLLPRRPLRKIKTNYEGRMLQAYRGHSWPLTLP